MRDTMTIGIDIKPVALHLYVWTWQVLLCIFLKVRSIRPYLDICRDPKSFKSSHIYYIALYTIQSSLNIT